MQPGRVGWGMHWVMVMGIAVGCGWRWGGGLGLGSGDAWHSRRRRVAGWAPLAPIYKRYEWFRCLTAFQMTDGDGDGDGDGCDGDGDSEAVMVIVIMMVTRSL